jgi:serine/threonine-protein kinase HipA
LLGVLSVQIVRGKEFFSFEFNHDWLKKYPTQILDPDLQLYGGPQFTAKNNFGILSIAIKRFYHFDYCLRT